MANNISTYIQQWGKGRWRTARKNYECEHFWSKKCHGDGRIYRGSTYFDTEELREWTKGPIFYRCCAACALTDESIEDEPVQHHKAKFTSAEFCASFA